MAKFRLFKGRNGQFYFSLIAPNGQPVCQSEGYVSKQGALNGINAVRGYAPSAWTDDDT